ncbi:MAG: hypothetical protein ABW321_33390, partial [Polyangiales bacterium]
MSVRFKLLIIVAFVALLPLGFLAYTTLGLHQEALRRKVSEVHVRSAKYGATLVETSLERAVASLKPTIETNIDWAALSPAELDGALWLLKGQLPAIVQIALIDDAGRVDPALALPPSAAGSALASPEGLRLLAAGISAPRVIERGFARGSPLQLPGSERLLLPVGFRITRGGGQHVLMIALDLAQPCDELIQDRPDHTQVLLVEANQRTLCAFPPREVNVPLEPALAAQLSSGQRASLRYRRADGTEMLAAAASTPWGFRVVVAQPLKAAFAASARMRLESVVWLVVGAISAVGAGLLLAR